MGVGLRRSRRLAGLAILACVLALTGCGAGFWTGPGYSVNGLFLYLRIGSLESAWQEIGPNLQASNRPVAATAPDGRRAVSLRWTSVYAFRHEAARQLAPFLRGARLDVHEGTVLARVVARAKAPSHAVAYFTLTRVDNEWVIQRLLVVGAAG